MSSPSLREQLEPLINDWASRVVLAAGDQVFAISQNECPVGQSETAGQLKQSGSGEPIGDLVYRIEYGGDAEAYASLTDEGTEAHQILGNPLLSFDWPLLGRHMILRSVQWVPGPGVAANIGWFSERSASEDVWLGQLVDAAASLDL